jgi:DNA-binding response OmpR family regulator
MTTPSSRSAPPCILVAEDDPAMRDLIVAELQRDGYRVLGAANADELLDRIGEVAATREDGAAAVALIISDVRMPGLTGVDLLAALRWSAWTTPVILITAFGDPALHAEARSFGALSVLDKPFPLEELRMLVRRTLPPAA